VQEKNLEVAFSPTSPIFLPVEYDFVLTVIGNQCLPPLHARSPDLANSAYGELAPVAAIADIRGWKEFLRHAAILCSGGLAVNQKSQSGSCRFSLCQKECFFLP